MSPVIFQGLHIHHQTLVQVQRLSSTEAGDIEIQYFKTRFSNAIKKQQEQQLYQQLLHYAANEYTGDWCHDFESTQRSRLPATVSWPAWPSWPGPHPFGLRNDSAALYSTPRRCDGSLRGGAGNQDSLSSILDADGAPHCNCVHKTAAK